MSFGTQHWIQKWDIRVVPFSPISSREATIHEALARYGKQGYSVAGVNDKYVILQREAQD